MNRRKDIKPFDLAEEPAPAVPANRAAISPESFVPALPGDADRGPVPASPLHLCPNCDYNLTGLTSRRCPECGEPFTLGEARMKAVEQSIPRSARAYPSWFEEHKESIGAAVIVIGLWILNVDPSAGIRGWLGLSMSGRGWYLFSMLISLGPIVMMVRFIRGRTVFGVFWTLGLLTACLTSLLLLI